MGFFEIFLGLFEKSPRGKNRAKVFPWAFLKKAPEVKIGGQVFPWAFLKKVPEVKIGQRYFLGLF